ncbi:MAG TPA: hypothetical protein VHA82_08995 [Ramlibacter sp.]|uniref:YfaP family protein n=1 Tax=Ramlibacter sp. TaxID=1917967 RepID=UPI002CAF758A|nr:hypothetical protein [Ramlibacter sp.]HVZ43933.1 hypothetical protein [Ramlibacter sp.]
MKWHSVFIRVLALALSLVAGGARAQLNIDFSNSHGTGISHDEVLIENMHLLVPVENPFQPGTFTTQEFDFNVTWRFDPVTLHLVPSGLTRFGGDYNCAAAQVQVRNAVTGQAISGATVLAASQTATTNQDGIATFTTLPQSFVSFTVVASGYVSSGRAASLACNVSTPVSIAMSPVGSNSGGLASGQFRIILTWGADPSDLDSHLTGPDGAGGRWHVYYANKTAGGICALDVDDVTSFGPETITCPATGTQTLLKPGVYRYSVHHYAGAANIGTSGASVRLEFGNGASYTYTPPASGFTGPKDLWTVFELTVFNDGSVGIAPVNSISNQTNSGAIQAVPKGGGVKFGRPEDPAMLIGLPAKN